MAKETKKEIDLSNKIVLKSVRGKVGIIIKMQPCRDPKTGNYPSCVKRVDSNGNMILSEKELSDPTRDFFIREDAVIDVTDGMTFDLDNVADRYKWEAIKNNPFIAPDYYAKDSKGNSLINGDPRPYGLRELYNKEEPRRYGIAELYVVRPGVESAQRISRKKLKHDAESFIYNDDRGPEGRILKAKLLGHKMDHMPDADVTDYLLQIAEADPEKIINLYRGGDMAVRLLFVEAREKHVINYKDKLYIYADVVLGASDEAAILYLKDPRNANVYKLIKKDTYPELIEDNSKN